MLTVGSLFSGIGGLDLGLERAGMQVRWQVENDPYCIRVLEKHWPSVKRYGDVRGVRWSKVEPVDLICGGFPCQPVSVAGARKGDKDDRWLWPEFLRAIREVRPKYALVENVPGLLSIDDGRLARGVFGDLAEIGYDAEWNIISAADVGAPHLRKRIFIVAHSGQSRAGVEIYRSGGQERSATRALESEILRQRVWPSGSERIDSDCEIVAHTNEKGLERRDKEEYRIGESEKTSGCGSNALEDTQRIGRSAWSRNQCATKVTGQMEQAIGSETPDDITHPSPRGKALGRRIFWRGPTRSDFWATESGMGGLAYGVPNRVDRLKCLGNAVVPQVAEYIGKLIIEAEGVTQ